MAQSGFTPIQIFRTTTAAAVPTAGDLAAGELAINLTDERLYFKNAAGVVKLLASNSGSLGTVTSVDVSGGTTGLTTSGGPITSSGTITLAGTLGVANGGTGATTFTANGVVYGNTTSALLVTAAGTTGQVLVGNTGGAPSWATLSGIGVTSFSAGTTGLTPNTATTGVVTLAGTLGVANGGTGTATAFTAGSVVFAGASGVYTQDNANFFWDNANDRLGIGTATPSGKLHINGNFLRIDQSGSNAAFLGNAADLITGAPAGAGLRFDGTALRIAASSTEIAQFTSGGNVGIGTTAPVTRLHVSQSNTADYASVVLLSNSANTAADRTGIYGSPASGTANPYRGGITFWPGSSGAVSIHVGNNATPGAGEAMRIDGTNSNVGIGTSSPGSKLDVVAQDAIRITGFQPFQTWRDSNDSNKGFRIQTAGGNTLFSNDATGGGTYTERMRLDTSGNLGIGTNSPSFKLDVVGNSAVTATFVRSRNNDATSASFAGYGCSTGEGVNAEWYSYSGSNTFGTKTNHPQLFITNNSERMRITSAGLVGIGTSSPQVGFHISFADQSTNRIRLQNTGASGGNFDIIGGLAGASNAGLSFFDVTNSATRMYIDSSGNLRVGTTGTLVSVNEKASFDCGSTNGLTTKTSGGASAWNYFAWNSATSGDNGFIEFGTEGSYTARGSITYNRAGGLVAYNTTSDYRAKDIIGPVTDAGATIDALKVYAGKMHGATIVRPMLIAHEAQEVTPYAVTGEKDAVNEDGTDKYQQVDHQSLVPLLIAELQSLRARVAQLEGN